MLILSKHAATLIATGASTLLSSSRLFSNVESKKHNEWETGFNIFDKVFHLLDKDGDKRLSRDEFEAGFELFDMDGVGLITGEEFNGSIDTFLSVDTHLTRTEYNAGFDMLDADKNGFVTRQEGGMLSSAAQEWDLSNRLLHGETTIKPWQRRKQVEFEALLEAPHGQSRMSRGDGKVLLRNALRNDLQVGELKTILMLSFFYSQCMHASKKHSE